MVLTQHWFVFTIVLKALNSGGASVQPIKFSYKFILNYKNAHFTSLLKNCSYKNLMNYGCFTRVMDGFYVYLLP